MQPKKLCVLEDGSSIEWADRETLRYKVDGCIALIWVDFEPGLFKNGRILRLSSVAKWLVKPEKLPDQIDDNQRNRIVQSVAEYYRRNGIRFSIEE